MNFELELKKHLQKAFSYPSTRLNSQKNSSVSTAQKLFKQALLYSFKGKASHFRPRLCFKTAQFLGHKPEDILPWAIALEMAHTGSLIHDDLPCMDDASKRRGQKCNHLVFGEEIALLTGTCLFVESFALLQDKLFDKKRIEFLNLLTQTLGFHGLMSGQAMDLKKKAFSKKACLQTMQLKTGVLISACVLGPALLWANKKEFKALEHFAKELGLAYQLTDDYQDLSQDNPHLTLKKQNLPSSKKTWLSKEGSSRLIKSKKALSSFPKRNKNLNSLIEEIQKKY